MPGDLANKSPVFQLKASLYTLTTLHLLEPHLEILTEQLAKLRHQAPKFFNSAPVIIDLQRLNIEKTAEPLDFIRFKEILLHNQLIVVGLRHVPESWQISAKHAGFALLPNATPGKSTGAHSAELPSAKPITPKNSPVSAEPTVQSTPQPLPSTQATTMTIKRSVRSGQQFYAKGADLIVIGSVSPGAEIIADGNIHVYGPLKGRALAGASGNIEARIFCQMLAAELVSIAGHYWTCEDIAAQIKNRNNAHIYLDQERLHVEAL